MRNQTTAACLLLLCLLFAAPAPAAQKIVLHPLDSLEGLELNAGRNFPEAALTLNTDPAYISEGTGSLQIFAVSPPEATGNSYLSVVLTTEPVDMTGRALVFDIWSPTAEVTRALYVRGYDAERRCVLSWNSWRGPLREEMRTFTLQPNITRPTALGWEAGRIESDDRSAVVRWEIYIGTSEKGIPFTAYIDNLHVIPTEMRSFMETTEPHTLVEETVLVAGGETRALIVIPEEAGWQPVGEAVAEAIRAAANVDFPVFTADSVRDEQLRENTVIMVGNVFANRHMLYAYSRGLVFADGMFPGPGGYELRTVHDPWGNGRNMIAVGAVDPQGALAAVSRLEEFLTPGEDLTLPRLFETQVTGEAQQHWGAWFTDDLGDGWVAAQHKRAEDGLARGVHTGLFGQAADIGQRYALTGRAEYAEMFLWLIHRAYEHYLTDPGTYGGPWGMDSDFQAHKVIPAWNVVQYLPGLDPQRRLETDRILFRWISEACAPKVNNVVGNDRVRYNHQTFPALGIFFAGEYFAHNYDSAEAENWLELAEEAFSIPALAFKPYEDANGYQWLTLYHAIQYALARPDFTIFENGNVRLMADYAILTMNNLGYQVPYGDTGAWVAWFSEIPVLRAALWYYRDPRYQWALEKKLPLRGQRIAGQYNAALPAEEPADLIGTRAWPLDPYYYRTFATADTQVPLEQTFDKVAFRSGFSPDDPYLLLDGLSNGGHGHLDGNSLLQWTQNGRVWLADTDYIKSLPKFHNGVLIFKNGQSATIPGFCELEHVTDLPGLGASITTLRDYAGVDWQRHVLWLRDSVFLVVDRMTARETDDYSFRAVWQTLGTVQQSSAGLSVEQKGQHARFATTPDARFTLNDDPDQGNNWSTYPFADEPVVRVWQAIYNRRLEAGRSFNIFTVMQASGEQPSTVTVHRVSDNVAIVSGLNEPVLVGVADETGRIGLAEEAFAQARALVVTPSRGFALGARSIFTPDGDWNFDEAADLEVDLASGQGTILQPAAVTTADRPEVTTRMLGFLAAPHEIRSMLQMLQPLRPGTAAREAVEPPGTSLVQRWNYGTVLDAYLLSSNARSFEAVDTGAVLTVTPDPLAVNVFSRKEGANRPENLLDGMLTTTDGSVMWDTDQQVTVTLSMDDEYDLDRLVLRAWFALTSSTGHHFQLGRIRILASNDDFAQDVRVLADETDTAQHPDWGGEDRKPQVYEFADLKTRARAVRLELTPRPGTGVYLSELELWGSGEGMAVDTADRKAMPTHTFRTLHTADLTGDGRDEIIAGSSNGQVYCFDADGQQLWSFAYGGSVEAVTTVEFAQNGRPFVVAGGIGGQVVCLDADGTEQWRFAVPFYKRTGNVRVLFAARLAAEGPPVVVAGTDNWHYYALDSRGSQLWHYESVHGSTAGAAADLDVDGIDEVICGTEYYWWHCVNADGSKRWSYSTKGGPGANAVAVGDLDGDGVKEVLFGGADTTVQAVDADGQALWQFNTGDEVQNLVCIDVTGDGRDEVLVTSLSFNVYCLDGEGTMLWRRELPDQVRAMALLEAGEQKLAAVGCDDGHVYVLQVADGTVVHHFRAGDRIHSIVAGVLPDGIPILAAAAANGQIYCLKLPARE